MISQFLKEIKT